MSATDELRRMLTEAGVEWWPEKYYKDACTVWRVNGMEWRASEQTDGRLLVGCTSLVHLTPEQAVEATLGRGTCNADETDTIKCWVKCKDEPSTEHVELIHVMECSECGGTYEHVNGSYEYCPRCGRKVVGPTTNHADAEVDA